MLAAGSACVAYAITTLSFAYGCSGTFAYKIASLPALKLLLVLPLKLRQEAELGPAFCTFGLLCIPACTSVQ